MIAEEGLAGRRAQSPRAVAAEIYGARILRKSIENDRQNFTRFFLLRRPGLCAQRHPAAAAGHAAWKTSLVFSHAQRAGSPVPRAERICAARSQSDQDRIAAAARQTLGVSVLSGFPGPGGFAGCAQRAEPPSGDGRLCCAYWAATRRARKPRCPNLPAERCATLKTCIWPRNQKFSPRSAAARDLLEELPVLTVRDTVIFSGRAAAHHGGPARLRWRWCSRWARTAPSRWSRSSIRAWTRRLPKICTRWARCA